MVITDRDMVQIRLLRSEYHAYRIRWCYGQFVVDLPNVSTTVVTNPLGMIIISTALGDVRVATVMFGSRLVPASILLNAVAGK